MNPNEFLDNLQSRLTDLIYLARKLPHTKKKKESTLINQTKETCIKIGEFYDSGIIDYLDLEEEFSDFNWNYYQLIEKRKYSEAEKLAQDFASLFVRQKQERKGYLDLILYEYNSARQRA